VSEYGRFVDQQVWVEWYDGYDKAMIRYILNRVKRDAKAVPTVFAAPERAFGQLAKVLNKKKRGVSGSSYTEKTIPLPFMSLSRLTDRQDFERRWHRSRIRKLQARDRQGKRMSVPMMTLPEDTDNFDAWEGQAFPTPVIIPYQLDAWARNLRDLDLIYKQIVGMMDLGDLDYLEVKHPEPWNWLLRGFRWTGMTNNSDLEVREGDERVLRYTFTFEVDAYIMKPSTSVKAVKAVELEVREWETEELIEVWKLYDVRVGSGEEAFDWDVEDQWDVDHRWDQ
jgi:hypothetical protein